MEIECKVLDFCSWNSSPKDSIFIQPHHSNSNIVNRSLKYTQTQTSVLTVAHSSNLNTLKPKHQSSVSHSSNPHSHSSNLAPLRVLIVSHSHSSNLAPTTQPHHSSKPYSHSSNPHSHSHSPSNLAPHHCSTLSLFKLSLSLFKPHTNA